MLTYQHFIGAMLDIYNFTYMLLKWGYYDFTMTGNHAYRVYKYVFVTKSHVTPMNPRDDLSAQ